MCKKLKTLLVVFLLFLLVACNSNKRALKKLGYNKEEIEQIQTLDESLQALFLNQYDPNLFNLYQLPGFDVNNYYRYVDLLNKGLTDELVIELVNKNILNSDNFNRICQIYNSPYFIAKNELLYLDYSNDPKYLNTRDLIEAINTKSYLPFYTNIVTTDVSKDYLLLVNKYYALPPDYVPSDLVEIEGLQIRKEVKENYEDLKKAASEAGYEFVICSAYRSYNYQTGLYNKYLRSDPVEVVDTYSARAGHSEHQSGLCMDISVPGVYLDNFSKTEASKWLAKECYKYGFIIRYPEDKVNVTGFKYEPWQIRYVGKEASKIINKLGITFDEYYACYVENGRN